MKAIQLTLALCALATLGKAQYTGQSFYGHNGSALLSSGTYVTADPGFIMGGYKPTVPAGTSNFFVDKVDQDATYTSGTAFSREYFMYDSGPNCTSNCMKQEQNCYGVTVIEDPNAGCSSAKYALTAAFDSGILFARLDVSGAVINSAFYTIPANSIPIKPLISISNTGDYYLVGAYNNATYDHMYVMKVNPAGVPAWSNLYDCNAVANSTCTPRGIVEDTYPGFNELAIAGTIGIPPSTDGFIMTVNATTGAPIIQTALASGQTLNESISSIALANSNGGYILGGFTVMAPGPDQAWMIRLNANATINWSSRFDPSTNTGMGEVIGVTERYSAVYADYEYYGLTLSTGAAGGMMVLKVDNNGNPFAQPGNMNNEFVYNDAAGNVALPSTISNWNVAGDINEGIHVFGTDQSAPGRFFLNQAFFNGATGTCPSTSQQNLTMIQSWQSGPQVTYNFNLSQMDGLFPCVNHYTADNPIRKNVSQPCSFNGLPPLPNPQGSNNRSSAPTGTGHNPLSTGGSVSVYPNPVTNMAEISYTAKENGEVKVTLCDILGKHIKTIDSGNKKAGTTTVQFDMNNLNLQNGVYLINVTVNGTTTQQKIVYSKN